MTLRSCLMQSGHGPCVQAMRRSFVSPLAEIPGRRDRFLASLHTTPNLFDGRLPAQIGVKVGVVFAHWLWRSFLGHAAISRTVTIASLGLPGPRSRMSL